MEISFYFISCRQLPWSEVKQEMMTKGLSEDVADLIGTYVQLQGTEDLVTKLQSDAKLMSYKDARDGVNEMAILYEYCNAMGVTNKV